MIKILKSKKLPIGIILLEILINLICYRFLPSKLSIHYDISGNIGYIPKLGFLFFMPLLSLAVYLFYIVIKNATETRALVACSLVLIVNVVLLFVNLI